MDLELLFDLFVCKRAESEPWEKQSCVVACEVLGKSLTEGNGVMLSALDTQVIYCLVHGGLTKTENVEERGIFGKFVDQVL